MKQYSVPFFLTPQEMRAFVARCDADFEQTMQTVAQRVLQSPQLRLLGLTGPTCSGKTTAAERMTDFFQSHGHRVHVISIDDFYFDKSVLHMRAESASESVVDYDSEDTIDLALLSEKINCLLSYKETSMPHFDFRLGKRTEGAKISPLPDDIFLFEGIQILYPKVHAMLNCAAYCSIYICPASSVSVGGVVFEPNDLRLMRRLVRDFRYRSSDPAFTLYLWQSVRNNEETNIFPNAHACNYVIDSSMPYEVGMLRPYLEDILKTVSFRDPSFSEAQNILRKIQAVQPIPSEYMTEKSLYKEFI